MPRVYCLLIIVSIARNWVANGQGGDCPPLLAEDLGHTGSFSEAGLISMALAVNATQPEVQLFNYTVVCIAQGTMKNTWRMVSGVALYNIMNGDLEPVTKQFHFQCDSDGSGWTTTVLNSTEFTLTAPNATTFNTDNRTDCALCVSPELMPEAENEHHCVGKSPEII